MITPRTWALSVLAGLATASSAAAVTPEEVWQHWQTAGSAQGYAVTAAGQVRTGDTLELTGVTLTVQDDDTSVQAPIGTVTMRDRGDGSVEIIMPDSYTMTLTVTEDDSTVEMALSVGQPGLTTTASGTADALRYELAAPELSVTLDSLVVDGDDVVIGFAVEFEGVAATYGTSGATQQQFDVTMTADAMGIALEGESTEDDFTMSFNLGSEDLAVSSSGTLVPGLGSGEDLDDLLRAGFAVDGRYGTGATEFSLAMVDGEWSSNTAGSLASSAVAFAINPQQTRYEVDTRGFDITVSGTDIPFPEVNVALDEFVTGFAFPLTRSDAPVDFSLVTRVVGLVVSDDVWAMFDPIGALPRDPATVIADVTGKMRLLRDVTDPDFGETDEMPAELHALDITEVKLSAVGAEVTGTGAFTFDNSDLTTFEGMPRPAGALDLRIVGANTLIDKLVAMGMLPEDQAMAGRMMLGLFAKKEAGGEDTMTSRIEVTPDGAVLANGQRIQ
jgi:hypothetical protein